MRMEPLPHIFDSLVNTSGHNCCGKLKHDEVEEGEEEPVQCVDLESVAEK